MRGLNDLFTLQVLQHGDSESLPKVEDKIGKPLSPYAITKYINELYAVLVKHTVWRL